MDDRAAREAAGAERAVVAAFGGDCTLPLAAWARRDGGGALRLEGMLATVDGRRVARGVGVAEGAEEAAAACVAAMRGEGAEGVLEAIRESGVGKE
jgi:hydroxymethylbilane synthase